MNERLFKLIRNHPVRSSASFGLAGLGLGLVAGYFIGRGRKPVRLRVVPPVKRDFEEVEKEIYQTIAEGEGKTVEEVEEEINDAQNRHPSSEQIGREFVQEKIDEHVDTAYDYSDEDDEVPRNIFHGTGEDVWDYDEELKHRSDEVPYILHRDEFYADEMGWRQTTLTYYSGDDIMADEEEAPVYGYLMVTGPLKFGHGSEDPNVLYVRNERFHAEYEILWDPGLFSVEVMGLHIEPNERVKMLEESRAKMAKIKEAERE